MTAILVVYGVVAAIITVGAVVREGPGAQPEDLVSGAFAGVLWPVLVPFVILWFVALGISNVVWRKR